MPKTYANLKDDEKCIYQAFAHLTGNPDKGPAMGAYVNKQNIDADDDEAVRVLAEKYNLGQIEMFCSKDWNYSVNDTAHEYSEEDRKNGREAYNLEYPNWEYILVGYKNRQLVSGFEALKTTVVKGKDVWAFLKRYPNSSGHAFYVCTGGNPKVYKEWMDDQGIFNKRPPAFATDVVVVACGRRHL